MSMVKDEADVIARSVRWTLAQGVERVLVIDNGSTDGTRDVLADLARTESVEVLDDADPAFTQSARITRLANDAHARLGAAWILAFDADELWTLPRPLPRGGPRVLSTGILDHVATALDDASDDNPFTRLRWRRARPNYQKVVVRWRRGLAFGDGNHWALEGERWLPVSPCEGLFLHHFPNRSPAQFHAKFLRGKRATDALREARPPSHSTHWKALGAIAEADGLAGSARLFRERYFATDPAGAGLVEDPIRWPDGVPAAAR